MTLMLASVTGPEEAETALLGGVDVIDLKDPARGALGAVEAATVAATAARLAGQRTLSAVAGDGPLAALLPVAEAMAGAGADIVKLGLAPGTDPAELKAFAPLAGRVRLVGVLFADLGPDLGLVAALAEAGFAGAMLDTARKGGGTLLEVWDLPAIAGFVAACRARDNFSCGLAGGLEPPDVPRLLVLEPALLGFRGALCRGGRAGPIDLEAVRLVRALIPREADEDAGRGVDWRVLAAHGYAPDPEGDPAVTDRVFVRDLVLPAFIGAYARERSAPQRVRFTVEVLVARSGRPTQDMRDIYSYDIISDGIRMLLAAGHVDLVETLAERIAALLLADARVVKACVRVEKLDLPAGVVGVAIERTRASMPEAGDLLWRAGSGGRSP
ncbi:MAG: dihydroneopterin aldolase [Alphaproteobacteria bacterium]|nr:dihydroneopterin aldolase [Alphaproteobacteria bacterium]